MGKKAKRRKQAKEQREREQLQQQQQQLQQHQHQHKHGRNNGFVGLHNQQQQKQHHQHVASRNGFVAKTKPNDESRRWHDESSSTVPAWSDLAGKEQQKRSNPQLLNDNNKNHVQRRNSNSHDDEGRNGHANVKITTTTTPNISSSSSSSGDHKVSTKTFGARKRKMVEVDFVFPQKQKGTASTSTTALKSYQFGSSQNSASSSRKGAEESGSSQSDAVTTQSQQQSSETIEDILYGSKSKPRMNTTTLMSPSAASISSVDAVAPASPAAKLADRSASAATRELEKVRDDDNEHDDSIKEEDTPHQLSVEEALQDKVGLRPRANSTDGELKLPQRGLCEERRVLMAYRWNTDRYGGTGKATPKGFSNLGNTCFLNSVTQCLAYLPPFAQILMSLTDKLPAQNGVKRKVTPGKNFTFLLRSLFQKVHGSNGSGGGALAPHGIARALPSLSACGSRTGYKFRPGRQEDAHEFLVHLLDAMNDGELREAGINQHKSGWRDRLPIPRLDETTFIHRVFGGYLRSQVSCTNCGYKSSTYDPFLDLSLEVSRKSCHGVMDAINQFTRKETLDSENRYKCDGCKKRVCASKQLTVFRPPLSLCIQLKRFTFSGFGAFGGFGSYGGRGGRKVTKPIEFPARLKLPLSDGRSCAYNLTGIVIHLGNTATSGHYTAYVKMPGQRNNWYHMDDSFAEPVSEKAVLRQKDAYLLFYSREEVQLAFPTPPLRRVPTSESHGLAASQGFSEEHHGQEKTPKKLRALSMDGTHVVQNAAHALGPPRKRRAQSLDGTEVVQKATYAVVTSGSTDSDSARNRKSAPRIPTKETPPPTNAATQEDSSSAPVSSSTAKQRESNSETTISSAPTEPRSTTDTSTSTSRGLALESIPQHNSQKREVGTHMLKAGKAGDYSDSGDDSIPAINSASATSSSGSSSSSSEDEDEEMAPKEADISPASLAVSHKLAERKAERVPDRPPQLENALETSSSVRKDAKKTGVTRITLDRGGGSGKVEAMLGPRHHKRKKKWHPEGLGSGRKGHDYDVLGTKSVEKWGDDDTDKAGTAASVQNNVRPALVQQIQKAERDKKRKMYVDQWDAKLDQGRKKKVKGDQKIMHANEGTKNRFQSVQTSMQNSIRYMRRGTNPHQGFKARFNRKGHKKKR